MRDFVTGNCIYCIVWLETLNSQLWTASFRLKLPSRALLVVLFFVGSFSSLQAMIFYSTADPNYNTTAPTGMLANSGWQWVGVWGGFQGVPIGPKHFIAARHIGGTVGDPFVLNGVTYTTVAVFDDTLSDLRIWQISGTFPSWAPLYRTGIEAGKPLIVFGRGLTRGTEVRDAATNTLRGWQWGVGDDLLRWGQNTVAAVVNGGSYWGDLLNATLDASGGINEVHLAVGDSSGPVFLDDGSGWKLAGVAAAVDAYFSTTNIGAGFNAAIFDARGLYYGSSGSWNLVGGTSPVPSGFYATRISVRAAWIDGVVPPVVARQPTSVPVMSTAWSLLLVALLFGSGVVFARPCRSDDQVKELDTLL